MASNKEKGTAFRGPEAQVALRMGPAVAVGQYFVIHPDNGGYYTADQAEVDKIESQWSEMTPSAADSPSEPAPAAPEPAPAPTPAPEPAPEPAK